MKAAGNNLNFLIRGERCLVLVSVSFHEDQHDTFHCVEFIAARMYDEIFEKASFLYTRSSMLDCSLDCQFSLTRIETAYLITYHWQQWKTSRYIKLSSYRDRGHVYRSTLAPLM